METKLTHEYIARFAPHGLKVLIPNGNIMQVNSIEQSGLFIDEIIKNQDKPILRHINTLTKPQMLEGYDEPVVPILEIAKFFFNYELEEFECEGEISYGWTEKYMYDGQGYHFDYYKDASFGVWYDVKDGDPPLYHHCSFECIQFLEKQKFNAFGIPDELVEYITEDFNPYITKI